MWGEVSLGQVLPFKYGRALPERERSGTGEYSVLSSAGITGSHNISLTKGPCVVIGRKGSIGTAYFCEKPVWPIDTTFYVEPSDQIDIRFAYYLIKNLPLKEMNNDSAVPGLNRSQAEGLNVCIPSLSEQRAIAATLGALDDKIESNRKLASGVSELADTLALDLIARVPTEILPLGQLVKFNQVAKKPYSTNAVRYIDIASVSLGSIDKVQELTWDEAPSRARRGVSDGDVIYSTVRPGNRAFALIVDPNPDIVVSTGFAVMSPSTRLGSSMLTTIAGSPVFANYLESVVHGSAYPAVNIQAIGDYPVVVSKDITVTQQFESRTMPLRRRAAQAQLESERLVALRDTLLPELLSGRLRASVTSQ